MIGEEEERQRNTLAGNRTNMVVLWRKTKGSILSWLRKTVACCMQGLRYMNRVSYSVLCIGTTSLFATCRDVIPTQGKLQD